jgi:hypothetical protein
MLEHEAFYSYAFFPLNVSDTRTACLQHEHVGIAWTDMETVFRVRQTIARLNIRRSAVSQVHTGACTASCRTRGPRF